MCFWREQKRKRKRGENKTASHWAQPMPFFSLSFTLLRRRSYYSPFSFLFSATASSDMVMITNFTANTTTQLRKFSISRSSSHFPPTLKHLFANEEVNVKCKKSQTMSELINKNPRSARLEARLSALPPLSQTTFMRALRRIKAPTKALHYFNWATKSGFAHNQHSYFMMLQILGRARHLNQARNFLLSITKKSNNAVSLTDKFFNTLIRSYDDAGLFQESLKVFELMKSLGISPSAITFNSLFLILLKRGRVRMVFELYDEMLRTYGVKPDSCTFNILIRGLCMNSMVDEGFRMFREMDKFECEPDLITYNTIVDGLCRAGKVNIARNVVNGMQKKCEDLRPNVVTYTSLMRGYCAEREIEEALDVFRKMVGEGLKPNNITFNTIIRGLCETQKLDLVKEVLGDSRFVPDTCTFNMILSAHCDRGNLDEALKAFEKMKELNVEQDSATYSILIQALCHKESFDNAEELLDEVYEKQILLRDNNCMPLTASYNSIFKYLCAIGKTRKAERVFRQLMKRGKPDPLAFETLIFGHCKEGTFGSGYKLLILMLRRDFEPNIKIYESLVEGLLRKCEAELALDTLKRMLRSSHLPRASVFHRILMELIEKGSSIESANVMMLMLDNEIRPNVNLSTDTVRVLYQGRMKERAFGLVKILYEKGYIVHMGALVSFLCQDRKLLEAFELVVFSLKNDQNIDIDVLVRVLTSLCDAGKLSEAFKLYYESLEKSMKLPLDCLVELRNAFGAKGKIEEAEFIAKRIPNSQH